MTFIDDLRTAVRGLSANKLRSSLTVLGILIGVGAVIILVAVGNGSSQAVANRIKALGTNTITITNRGRFGRGPATTGTQTQSATITQQDVNMMEDPNQAPDILSVSPVVQGTEDVTYGAAEESSAVTGTTPTYFGAEDYTIEAGRAITQSDLDKHAQVVVIGTELASDLFSTGQNPIGADISIDGFAGFQVVGVLNNISTSGVTDSNTISIVPYTTAEDLVTGYTNNFTDIIVQARSSGRVNAAEQEASDILANANQTSVANLPFNVLNEASLLSTSQSNNETFTVLLGAVAAISLLVGGIGVMNIMLVTVTERTREIGIRKAIGAPRRAILSQFLIEAVMLSLIGGIVGVAVGLVGSRFKIVGVKPIATPTSVIEAFVVAVAVGVFFGFYPASRAAALRPVDALRYE